MESVVFEIIMGIFFDAGMLAMVVHAAQHIGEDTGRVRFTAAVFAIGFFLGMIAKCVVGGSYIALALYALYDDAPLRCEHHYCSLTDDRDATTILLVPQSEFPVCYERIKTDPQTLLPLFP